MRNTLLGIFGMACAASVVSLGCDGGQVGSGGSGGSAGAQSGGSAGDGGAGTGGDQGGGGTGSGGGPACSGLGDSVRVTQLTVQAGGSGRAVTAQRGDGSVVAWAGGDGNVHVLPLGADDQAAGSELSVEGTQVFGAAAIANDVALLVSRPPDFMTFVRIDDTGQTLSSTDLVGGGDHNEIGIEWFGEFANTGRFVMQADGTYAAYHALHRRWPDNIGHQGDTLRLLAPDGSALGGGWDWGCSHSLDQRLAVGPTGLVPICASDCYPAKGIWYNHDTSMITDDPGANCAGGYTTSLGGLAAVEGGFFLVYKDAAGTAHLGRFDGQGAPVSTRDLTEPGTSRLARYEDGLLIGSPGASGGATIEKLDPAGDATGEKTDVAAELPDQDFESRTGGEVAWASVNGTTLTVVRVRACLP